MTYYLYYMHLSKAQDYMDSMLWEQEAASSSLATPIRQKATIQRWKWRLHRGFICCTNALKMLVCASFVRYWRKNC